MLGRGSNSLLAGPDNPRHPVNVLLLCQHNSVESVDVGEREIFVPWTSFSENEHLPDGTKPPVWFALSEARPLSFFAGIWTPQWKSVRLVKEGETSNDLFGFLTTEPNKVVGAIHPKAMPVILTTPKEIETWMTGPTEEALMLQRPLPDGSLKIVARGSKQDG